MIAEGLCHRNGSIGRRECARAWKSTKSQDGIMYLVSELSLPTASEIAIESRLELERWRSCTRRRRVGLFPIRNTRQVFPPAEARSYAAVEDLTQTGILGPPPAGL